MTSSQYAAAEALIDEAHAQDPNLVTVDGKSVPYELHYAQRSTYYLAQRTPAASPELRTAVRAQHFRRYVKVDISLRLTLQVFFPVFLSVPFSFLYIFQVSWERK